MAVRFARRPHPARRRYRPVHRGPLRRRHRLPSHHRNFNKRLVKTPKLYFLDTGLAARLLGIETELQLATHPLRGALFETWVVSEHLKARFNRGLPANLSFWRDRAGHEVDLLIERENRLWPVKVKVGATITADASRGLLRWIEVAGDAAADPTLVYAGEQEQTRSGVKWVPWREWQPQV